ncbi:PREDICTED: DNA topoisomerase 6 subunit A3-like [Fragaria vesca subsp. vesca]|uniref:DNA topoisomerase 6 subunit A3-like n=1 Tax=Fragaria vesca subsp. vesca TaxID=101020 RepID=UPI0002C356E5|nr:PREDICTED: DNA topoisomerase 6 subunit A3-like [Fragaria vesca subsp. vesca]
MMKNMQLSEPNDNEHSKQVVLAALDSIIELLDMDIHCDLIMLYYRHHSVFGRQSVSDLAVDYICSTLGCSQSTLNIIESDSEGLPGYVAGLFSFKMDGIEHFCSNLGPYGKTIPPRTKMATDMKNHGALFVLLVQNSSVFITLTQYGFVNDYQCILIAGEDFPTTEIISFTKKVSEELKLPLFCLLNWDPVNLRILSGCGGAGPTKL